MGKGLEDPMIVVKLVEKAMLYVRLVEKVMRWLAVQGMDMGKIHTMMVKIHRLELIQECAQVSKMNWQPKE